MELPCPFCTQELLYDPNLAGKTVACSYCKKHLLIPSLQQLPIQYQQEYREEQDHLRKKQEAKQKKFEKQVDEELRRQRQEKERSANSLEQEQLGEKGFFGTITDLFTKDLFTGLSHDEQVEQQHNPLHC